MESIGPKSLAPGESIALKITVRVRETVGPLQHRALVETDLPGDSVLEFWTMANIIPRVRVEETTEKISPMFPGQSSRRNFVAFAYGTATAPPLRLDDSTVKATSGVTWGGPSRERKLDEQIVERSRPFTIVLKAEGKPGSRIEDISLVNGKEILWRQQLGWEVASPLKATPPGIIITTSGPLENKVILRSVDQRPFQVLGTESNLPGVTVEAGEGVARAVHVLRVKIKPAPHNQGRGGQVTIKTNHPNQPTASISVFISSTSPTAHSS